MSFPISGVSSLQTPPAPPQNEKTVATGIESEGGSINTKARNMLNSRIIEASLRVSISAGENSQELLFRSALDSIYEAISAPTQTTELSHMRPVVPNEQVDSPEAASGIILTFSLGLFETYAAQHPGKDPAQLATDFVDLVRGGFEKGFNEAVDILKGLGVFNGSVEKGIQKTYELVMKGFDDFLASKLAPAEPEPAPAPAPETPAPQA